MKALIYIALLLVSCSIAHGQAPQPKIVSAGVLNGKATSLPKPEYPESAREAKVEGEIKVKVLIDESGKVISATAGEGIDDRSLRLAAESAALKATFSPTLLAGNPVKVSGVIAYRFVLTNSNEERLRIMSISAFLSIVRASAADLAAFRAAMEGDDILRTARDEFPEFTSELDGLSALEKLTPAKRVELMDRTATSISAKLNASNKWQFAVGKELGDVMGTFMRLAAESKGQPDLTRLDRPALKASFTRLEQLMASVPVDFPREVLARFNDLLVEGNKSKLATPEEIDRFMTVMTGLLETISPEEK